MTAHSHPTRTERHGHLDGPALKLAVARDLARIYADVLHDPLPPDLRWLIGCLEQQLAPEASAARPPA
jgi:hypothetical protein